MHYILQSFAVLLFLFLFNEGHGNTRTDLPFPEYDIGHSISYDDLLNIARKGLPKTASKKKIIVVGAGMAGLTAAYALEQAGHEVTILEASDHVGGRILTYRDKAGWQVELGAMRIPESHKLLGYYVNELFQLETKMFINSDPEAYYYVNGIRMKVKDYQKDPDSLGFDTLPGEKGKTAEDLFVGVVEPYLEEIRAKGWKYFFDSYDHMSLIEFLDRKTNLSRSAIVKIGKLANLEACFHFSFCANVRSFFKINGDEKFFYLPKGNDRIPEAFRRFFKETRIMFNARVVRVTQDSHQVTAEYIKNAPSGSEKSNITANYLLMATSAPVASFVEFQPSLSFGKRNALRSIYHDFGCKIALAFSTRFWEKDGIYGGKSITDLPSREFYYFPGNTKFFGGVVVSYTWSHDSYLFAGMSEKECLQIALNNLATIHGQHIREFYIGGVVKHWLLDPFTLGAFTFHFPLQCSNIYEELRRNEGQVWFAGEYTSVPHLWIETAVKSGLLAAVKMHRTFENISTDEEIHSFRNEL